MKASTIRNDFEEYAEGRDYCLDRDDDDQEYEDLRTQIAFETFAFQARRAQEAREQ